MTLKFIARAITCSLIAATMVTSAVPASAADESAPTPAATDAKPAATDAAPTNSDDNGKVIFKPGQALSVDANTEDIAPTWDIELAKKQAAAYPDSPEASFILAVALTRTSRVEEALKEVQHARKLAESKGGPAYFDKMIGTYETMLKSYPDDNRVRYGLAWAYYMKAYLLSRQSRRTATFKAANPTLVAQVEAQQKTLNEAAAKALPAEPDDASGLPPAATNAKLSGLKPAGTDGTKKSGLMPAGTSAKGKPAAQAATAPGVNKDVVKALSGSPLAAAGALSQLAANAGSMSTKNPPALDSIPHIPGALEKVDPIDVPIIKAYFERAIKKIDEILERDPNDVWSVVYGAHLRAEYTGNLAAAMKTWRVAASKFPNNPAPYFFLGEGYLRQGNLRDSINSISRALMLRSM
ncbi:MAG TPA: tetratricopeptide repeat protein [Candidatus Obscuribacterales bacterium]